MAIWKGFFMAYLVYIDIITCLLVFVKCDFIFSDKKPLTINVSGNIFSLHKVLVMTNPI